MITWPMPCDLFNSHFFSCCRTLYILLSRWVDDLCSDSLWLFWCSLLCAENLEVLSVCFGFSSNCKCDCTEWSDTYFLLALSSPGPYLTGLLAHILNEIFLLCNFFQSAFLLYLLAVLLGFQLYGTAPLWLQQHLLWLSSHIMATGPTQLQVHPACFSRY